MRLPGRGWLETSLCYLRSAPCIRIPSYEWCAVCIVLWFCAIIRYQWAGFCRQTSPQWCCSDPGILQQAEKGWQERGRACKELSGGKGKEAPTFWREAVSLSIAASTIVFICWPVASTRSGRIQHLYVCCWSIVALSHQMHCTSTVQTATCLIRDLTSCHHVCLFLWQCKTILLLGIMADIPQLVEQLLPFLSASVCTHLTARSTVVGRRQRQREHSTWMLQGTSPERADLARASHFRSRRLDQKWKVRCTRYSLLLSCFWLAGEKKQKTRDGRISRFGSYCFAKFLSGLLCCNLARITSPRSWTFRLCRGLAVPHSFELSSIMCVA